MIVILHVNVDGRENWSARMGRGRRNDGADDAATFGTERDEETVAGTSLIVLFCRGGESWVIGNMLQKIGRTRPTNNKGRTCKSLSLMISFETSLQGDSRGDYVRW
jgi:hypothetical protein